MLQENLRENFLSPMKLQYRPRVEDNFLQISVSRFLETERKVSGFEGTQMVAFRSSLAHSDISKQQQSPRKASIISGTKRLVANIFLTNT